MKNNCVFCAIAAGEIPSFKVYEDDDVLAYMDTRVCHFVFRKVLFEPMFTRVA